MGTVVVQWFRGDRTPPPMAVSKEHAEAWGIYVITQLGWSSL